ncbi:hypothetical protein IDG63_14505, partial [Staphylococcus sp. EG-SA-14]|nr:hypothetical protein [Staphylococcus sp. EG-SA-14]
MEHMEFNIINYRMINRRCSWFNNRISYHYQGDDSKIYAAAFTAAIFHLINHATFKGALFMITGAVD